MPSYKLHAPPGSFRAFPILIAAEYNDITVDVADDFDAKKVTALSPSGKAPILELSNGEVLFSSHAIARYVTNLRRDTGICGNSIYEAASIDSWMDFASAELELPACVWFYPVAGYMPFNQDAYKKAKIDLASGLETLESHLSNKTHLVGDHMTLADIVIVSTLLYPFKLVASSEYTAPFPNVIRWFKDCVSQPEFVAVMGATTLCKKELLAKGCVVEKQEPKESKPVVESTPQKSAGFDLNSWKATYETGDASVMYKFWSSYDKENWSLWKCTYDYADDNEELDATKEIVTSFMKNTEVVKDSCFGVMHVCGKLEIEGMWLFKGADPEVLFGANEDTSWFSWSQYGPAASDKVKAAVAQIWAPGIKDVAGKAIQDTQVFGGAAAAASGGDGFDLAGWKSKFTTTKPGIMDEFWSSYDKENWSLWRCTYDYADDNEELQATKDIVTSFMTNTESVKDSCFGVMHVCGKLEIEGLWLFKGADPEVLFGANEDTSWFSWSQYGPSASDKVKAAVAEIWATTDTTIDGKAIINTQVFNK